jgi:hypothetical protein
MMRIRISLRDTGSRRKVDPAPRCPSSRLPDPERRDGHHVEAAHSHPTGSIGLFDCAAMFTPAPRDRFYRHSQRGWSAPNNAGQWRRVPSNPGLEQQRQSRSLGQSRQDEFQRLGRAPGIPRTSTPPGRTFAPPRSPTASRRGGRG